MRTSAAVAPGRRKAGGLVVVVAAALLSGCAGNDGSRDEAAASSTPAPELSSGLLQAESFGPDASVVAVTLEQLRAGAGLGSLLKDATVSPECGSVLQGTQPDVDAFDDVAGVVSTAGSTVTVEMLVRGGPTEGAVGKVSDGVEKCPRAELTSPSLGRVTVDFRTLPVPDLGDAAVALQYTATVSAPDGAVTTVPALLGVVEDDDRLLVLVRAAVPAGGPAGDGAAPTPGPAPVDPDPFVDLLEDAYQTQADALG